MLDDGPEGTGLKLVDDANFETQRSGTHKNRMPTEEDEYAYEESSACSCHKKGEVCGKATARAKETAAASEPKVLKADLLEKYLAERHSPEMLRLFKSLSSTPCEHLRPLSAPQQTPKEADQSDFAKKYQFDHRKSFLQTSSNSHDIELTQ